MFKKESDHPAILDELTIKPSPPENLDRLRPERRRNDRRSKNFPVEHDRRKNSRRATQLSPEKMFLGVGVIVEQVPITARGIDSILKSMGIRVAAIGETLDEVIPSVGDRLDIIVFGRHELDLFELQKQVQKAPARPTGAQPATLTLLDSLEPAYLRTLLSQGFDGIIERNCSIEDFKAAIERVLAGDRVLAGRPLAVLASAGLSPTPEEAISNGTYNPLTPKEMEVLAELAQHGTNRQISKSLHISEATVKTHLARIYTKLDVPGRREAVLVAVERGLLQ